MPRPLCLLLLLLLLLRTGVLTAEFSQAGLNTKNVDYVAKAMDKVVRES